MHGFTRIVRRGLAWAILLMLALSALSAMAEANAAYISGKNARVYGQFSLTGPSVSVRQYTLVEVVGIQNGVALIRANGYEVYIDASQLITFDTSAGTEMVFDQAARVYAYPTTSSRSAVMTEGASVNLVYSAGSCAVVEKNGVMAYTYLSALSKPETFSDCNIEAVVKSGGVDVYASPKSSARKLCRLSKDDRIQVTAVSANWARVEKNGAVGYCAVSALEKYKSPIPTAEEIFANDATSNEQKVYAYLVYIIKLSPAASCGVLANIKCESGFKPTTHNTSDPYGGSYGICQWLAGRRTNLQNYCAEKGYDYTTLEGQCHFLNYELTNRYPKVLQSLKSVENTAQGAYEAGYNFCYNYEVPSNRASRSVQRGEMAMYDFWPKYVK